MGREEVWSAHLLQSRLLAEMEASFRPQENDTGRVQSRSSQEECEISTTDSSLGSWFQIPDLNILSLLHQELSAF